jgi:spermidine/putrescine-binding protein
VAIITAICTSPSPARKNKKWRVNISYSIPKEGKGSFFDMLAIPADARTSKKRTYSSTT